MSYVHNYFIVGWYCWISNSKSSVKDSLIYSYGRSFNGFAANLTDEEVESFSGEIVNY